MVFCSNHFKQNVIFIFEWLFKEFCRNRVWKNTVWLLSLFICYKRQVKSKTFQDSKFQLIPYITSFLAHVSVCATLFFRVAIRGGEKWQWILQDHLRTIRPPPPKKKCWFCSLCRKTVCLLLEGEWWQLPGQSDGEVPTCMTGPELSLWN